MSTSRTSYWKKDIPHIITMLREGPKTVMEMARIIGNVQHGKVPDRFRKRVERNLPLLCNANVVTRGNDGKWWWYTYRRSFKNQGEYEAWQRHSEDLITPMQTLRDVIVNNGLLSSYRSTPAPLSSYVYFEAHVRTGYPDLNSDLNEYREQIHVYNAKLQTFHGHIRPAFIQWYQGLKGHSQDAPTLSDIEGVIEFVKYALFRSITQQPAYTSPSMDTLSMLEVRVFTQVIMHDRTAERTMRTIIQLMKNIAIIGERIVEQLMRLEHRIQTSRTPIEGHCEMCPNISIQ